MSDDLIPVVPTARKPTLGDRMRAIANQLRQEDDVQIKATSRILGAAAKLAENHDRLIDEVVDMVEDDLNQSAQAFASKPYTVSQLKQQFKSLNEAKAHFGIKAASWDALVTKLNAPASASQEPKPTNRKRNGQSKTTQEAIAQRLETIESDIQLMRGELSRVIQLLEALTKKML